MLPIILMSTQQLPVVKCFGNIQTSRKQYKKVKKKNKIKQKNQIHWIQWNNFQFQVNKATYSYFMVLRKFYT